MPSTIAACQCGHSRGHHNSAGTWCVGCAAVCVYRERVAATTTAPVTFTVESATSAPQRWTWTVGPETIPDDPPMAIDPLPLRSDLPLRQSLDDLALRLERQQARQRARQAANEPRLNAASSTEQERNTTMPTTTPRTYGTCRCGHSQSRHSGQGCRSCWGCGYYREATPPPPVTTQPPDGADNRCTCGHRPSSHRSYTGSCSSCYSCVQYRGRYMYPATPANSEERCGLCGCRWSSHSGGTTGPCTNHRSSCAHWRPAGWVQPAGPADTTPENPPEGAVFWNRVGETRDKPFRAGDYYLVCNTGSCRMCAYWRNRWPCRVIVTYNIHQAPPPVKTKKERGPVTAPALPERITELLALRGTITSGEAAAATGDSQAECTLRRLVARGQATVDKSRYPYRYTWAAAADTTAADAEQAKIQRKLDKHRKRAGRAA